MTPKLMPEDISIFDYVTRWDDGNIIATVEMGGMGPGYEQAIQIAMIEFMRWLKVHQPELDDAFIDQSPTTWETLRENAYKASYKNPVITDLGLSGAQADAALNLAARFVHFGIKATLDAAPSDRRIWASKKR